MAPLASIIIPVYNVEKFLERCLASVCAQTYARLEIILVDDGSADASGQICDRFSEKDPRIQVIHQKNEGVSAARRRQRENISILWMAMTGWMIQWWRRRSL